jgi:large subunit ribosomal protein L23
VATVSKDPRDIILQPVVSEKSYGLLDANTYTFVVATSANKIEIRQAVEEIFNVKVLNVTTMNRGGKRKRNRRTNTMGQRPTTKRAVVKVAADDRIDIFGS